MKKLKFIFKAFRETYQKLNEEKIEAKQCVKVAKYALDTCIANSTNMHAVYNCLSEIYDILPATQRVLYVQDILDLFYYGKYLKKNKTTGKLEAKFSSLEGFADTNGYMDVYDNFVMELSHRYDNIVLYYKKGCYKGAIEAFNSFNLYHNHFKDTVINDDEKGDSK